MTYHLIVLIDSIFPQLLRILERKALYFSSNMLANATCLLTQDAYSRNMLTQECISLTLADCSVVLTLYIVALSAAQVLRLKSVKSAVNTSTRVESRHRTSLNSSA